MGCPYDSARSRIYKPVISEGVLKPLSGTLFSFQDEQGQVLTSCDKLDPSGDIANCANGAWKILQVSAETESFSIFTALDSATIFPGILRVELEPVYSAERERELKVEGDLMGHDLRVYADDDNRYAGDEGDNTAPVLLPIVQRNGKIFVTIPGREVSHIFFIPTLNGTERAASIYHQKVQLLAAEFLCSLQETPVWLGTVNGKAVVDFSCNHPGEVLVSIQKANAKIAEVKSTLTDFWQWNGVYKGRKITKDTYSTRFVASSVTAEQLQFLGPNIQVDDDLPVLEQSDFSLTSQLLTPQFVFLGKVSDLSSGVDSIHLTLKLGEQYEVFDGPVLVDEEGTISVLQNINREIANTCGTCYLNAKIEVFDRGNNHIFQEWQSAEPVLPYPNLLLWYPFLEGQGNIAQDRSANVVNMNLSNVSAPWRYKGQIYLQAADITAAAKRVTLSGTVLSADMWLNMGYNSLGEKILMEWIGQTNTVELGVYSEGNKLIFKSFGDELVFPSVIQRNQEQHFAFVVTNEFVKLYLNGSQVAVSYWSNPWAGYSAGYLHLGAHTASESVNAKLSNLRIYSKALDASTIAALASDLLGAEALGTQIYANAGDASFGADYLKDLSCAIPGLYLVQGKTNNPQGWVSWNISIPEPGEYGLSILASSAQNGEVLLRMDGQDYGSIDVAQGAWNKFLLKQGSSVQQIPLQMGNHTIELRPLNQVSLGGVALAKNLEAKNLNRLTWPTVQLPAPQVEVKMIYDNFPDKTWVQPKLTIKNIGSTSISNYKVRYYFRGEDPVTTTVSTYYPYVPWNIGASGDAFYAQLNINGYSLAPGEQSFWGAGPHFGIRSTNGGTWWVKEDDPSFDLAAVTAQVVTDKVPILDSEYNLLSNWSCFEEGEAANEEAPQVEVYAYDARQDGFASNIFFNVKNVGQGTIQDLEVRYYYTVDAGQSVNMANLHTNLAGAVMSRQVNSSNGAVMLSFVYDKLQLAADSMISSGYTGFEISQGNWTSWNISDDYSHQGLGSSSALAINIVVLDKNGQVIWGQIPNTEGGFAMGVRP